MSAALRSYFTTDNNDDDVSGNNKRSVKQDLSKLCRDLQELVGDSPDIQLSDFTNWGKNIKYKHVFCCRPTTLSEVQVNRPTLCFVVD